MTLLQDLRYGLRLLRRAPGFAVIAILVLALGIGANAAVFSIVNALVLRPQAGRLGDVVGVFNRGRAGLDGVRESYRAFSYPAYVDIRDGNDVFEGLTAYAVTLVGVGEGTATRRMLAAIVASNYFSTLGASPVVGRPFLPEEEKPNAGTLVAVASYEQWRQHAFAQDFVGSVTRINGLDFTVVGVAPRGFNGTMGFAGPSWWFPLGAYDQIVSDFFREGARDFSDRAHAALSLVGTLRPGVTTRSAQPRLELIARRLALAYPDTDRDRVFEIAPQFLLGSSVRPQSNEPILAISAILVLMATLVLVVACLNLANLMLARGNARRREIAVRMALGGGRLRIVRQLLTEALVLSGAGAAGGLLVADWTMKILARSLAENFPIAISIDADPDARVLAAAAGFAVLSTLAFALGPAFSLARGVGLADAGAEGRTTAADRRGSRVVTGPRLIVAQLALSLALVATGGLFVRGAMSLPSLDAGFGLDHQLVAGIDPGLGGFGETRGRELYRALLERVRALPGVERASMASLVAFGDERESRQVYLPGSDESVASPTFEIVGANYFDTLGLRLRAGREFTMTEEAGGSAAAAKAIVNEPLARQLFGDVDPVGRQIQIRLQTNDPLTTFEIIGVAPGLRQAILDPAPVPQVYVSFGGHYRSSMNIHVRTNAGVRDEDMLSALGRELRSLDNRLPILRLRTMTAHRDASVFSWMLRAAAALFGSFGILALLLAAIGVYGLEAYNVSRRTREIGIRLALGARTANVAQLVLSDGLRATAWGLAIGMGFALASGRLVSGFLFQVSPFDPVVLAASALVLAAAVAAACLVPLRRAVRVEPLAALRAD